MPCAAAESRPLAYLILVKWRSAEITESGVHRDARAGFLEDTPKGPEGPLTVARQFMAESLTWRDTRAAGTPEINSSTPQVHFSRPYGTEIDLSTTRALAGERLGMTTVHCLRNCIAPG